MKNKVKYVPLLVLFIILSMSVGYSAFNNTLHVSDISGSIRAEADIRVTGVSVSSSTGGAVSTSEDYNVKDMLVDFTLPENGTITYKVEITNFGNVEMGIISFDNLPSNITYSITDYTLKDPICDSNNPNKCTLGAVKEFYVTFSYTENGYDSSNEDYSIIGHFEFARFYTVTYINAPRENNYKTKTIANTEFTQDGLGAGGGTITYTSSGTVVSGATYNLSQRKVTVPAEKVTEDFTIWIRPLGEYINKLYADGTKSTVNNGTNVVTYNRVTSQYLINDRKGGSVGADEGNVRYYSTSANNHIYYNCQDYDNQSSSTCETWRIIGVFDNKVKIVRTTSIGNYSFDTSSNKWANAAINKLLNQGYDNESVNGSLYWNASSGKCYTCDQGLFKSYYETSCDFSGTGLKNNDTREFITTETLYFTSPNSALRSIGNLYRQEHGEGSIYSGNDRTWTGKVSLPYPSDYYFSANLSNCNADVYWIGTGCSNTSFMKQSFDMWTVTPGQSGGGNGWYIKTSGGANYNDVYEGYAILPTLYLKTNTVFFDGDGSSSNPYRIYPMAN